MPHPEFARPPAPRRCLVWPASRWSSKAASCVCATSSVSVPGRVIVFRKNRAAAQVVIPICRAFNTIFRSPRRRSKARCTALAFNGAVRPYGQWRIRFSCGGELDRKRFGRRRRSGCLVEPGGGFQLASDQSCWWTRGALYRARGSWRRWHLHNSAESHAGADRRGVLKLCGCTGRGCLRDRRRTVLEVPGRRRDADHCGDQSHMERRGIDELHGHGGRLSGVYGYHLHQQR